MGCEDKGELEEGETEIVGETEEGGEGRIS